MKLAEALLLRGDFQKDLGWIREQLRKGARVQEGETPAEDPAELVTRAEARSELLRKLMVRINEANLKSVDSEGRSLTDLLAQRDILRLKHVMYSEAYGAGSVQDERYGRSEIRWKASFNMKEMRDRVEKLSVQLRELNAKVQQMNWSIEVGDI